jgi:hypothetical protein
VAVLTTCQLLLSTEGRAVLKPACAESPSHPSTVQRDAVALDVVMEKSTIEQSPKKIVALVTTLCANPLNGSNVWWYWRGCIG